MRQLHLALEYATLTIRFWLAWLMLAIGYGIAYLATKFLPRNHPSRTYTSGRVREGRSRVLRAARIPRRN